MNFSDELYMNRALDLAALGIGFTMPNPMVGCVIVHNGKIIGEGWHQKYGGPHAEVNSINSVANKNLLPESTVYVTLEPCSHFGKTPPCADLLIKHKVKKVIICNHDPNPLVAGRGIKRLEEAGIEVESGFLDEKGSVLNRRFFTFHQKKRPYIILKWAQTADGFIAKTNFEPAAISGPVAKNLVHKWRSEEAAILVGTRTAKYDNPKLNVREWTGTDPIRLIIDKNLKLGSDLHAFDKNQPTLVFNLLKNELIHENLEFIRLESESDFLSRMFSHLYQRQIQSILVEGGTFLLSALIKTNLWDEARILHSPIIFDAGINGPELTLNNLIETEIIGQDQLYIYQNYTQNLSNEKNINS